MATVDLRDQFLPVWSQKGLESCTALMMCDAIWWELKRQSAAWGKSPPFIPSALFVYYNARKRAGHENLNIAVRPSDVMAAVQEYGVCPESLWRYSPARYRDRPSTKAYQVASCYKGIQFEPLPQNLSALKASLAAGRPFFFCLRLFPSNYQDFGQGEIALTGDFKFHKPEENPVYNHAMLAVGYDEATSMFVIRNSFGSEWGKGGYLFLPFEALSDSKTTYGFWRVKTNSIKVNLEFPYQNQQYHVRLDRLS